MDHGAGPPDHGSCVSDTGPLVLAMLIGRSSSILCSAHGIDACHYRDADEATHSWTECLVTVDLPQVWRDLLDLL